MNATNELVLKTARMLIQDIEGLDSVEKGFFENLARGASSAIRGVPGKVKDAYRNVAGAINQGLDTYAGTDAPRVEYSKDGKVTGAAVKGSKARRLGGLERAGRATGRRMDRGVEAVANAGRNAVNAVGSGIQAGRQAVGSGVQAGRQAVGSGVQALGRGANAAADAAANAAYGVAGAVDRGVQGAKDMYGKAKDAVGRGANNAVMGAVDAAGKVDAAAGKARRGLGGWLSGLADTVSGKKRSTSGGSSENDGWDTNLMGSKSIVSYINSRINFYENN